MTRNYRMCVAVAATLTALVTAGCYKQEGLRGFLQEPRRPVSGVEYRVYPPDVISITSRQVHEISGATQRVRPDGKVNLPLLGEIFVAGHTPKEIEAALTVAARDYYEQVDATVQVAAYNSQSFYVFGQVGRPGPMPWTGRDTLLDVLARAQPTTLAWPERIVVLRGDQPQEGGYATTRPSKPSTKYTLTGVRPATKDRPRKKMIINLMAMVKSGDMSNNVLLMPNDVVYVQPNPLAKIGLTIQNLLFPVRSTIETLGVPARAAGAGTMP